MRALAGLVKSVTRYLGSLTYMQQNCFYSGPSKTVFCVVETTEQQQQKRFGLGFFFLVSYLFATDSNILFKSLC